MTLCPSGPLHADPACPYPRVFAVFSSTSSDLSTTHSIKASLTGKKDVSLFGIGANVEASVSGGHTWGRGQSAANSRSRTESGERCRDQPVTKSHAFTFPATTLDPGTAVSVQVEPAPTAGGIPTPCIDASSPDREV